MRSRVFIVCLLLAGCAPVPVAPPAPDLYHDALFVAPSTPIDASHVFALSDAMKAYVRDKLASHQYKGARQALIDAVSQGQLRLEYDSVTTRNAAEAFDAKAGNCLSLVIMTAAFAKALGLDVQYNAAAGGDLWSRSGNIYFLNGHVNVTLGRRSTEPSRIMLYDSAELLTIDFLPGSEIRRLHSTPVGENTILAMYMNNRAAEAL